MRQADDLCSLKERLRRVENFRLSAWTEPRSAARCWKGNRKMSESINTIRGQLWEKMRSKAYRDTFVAAHLSTNIAAQIQTMREARGWSQKQLAERADMAPSRISVMEDPSYDKLTLSTLKRLASAFDVGFVARFEEFSKIADWVANLSPEKMEVRSYADDRLPAAPLATAERSATLPKTAQMTGLIYVFDPA